MASLPTSSTAAGRSIGSLFVWSAVTWLTGQMQTYHQMLACRALMGISEAFYMPAALALIADYHIGNTRAGHRHPSERPILRARPRRHRRLHRPNQLLAKLLHLVWSGGVIYSVVLIARILDARTANESRRGSEKHPDKSRDNGPRVTLGKRCDRCGPSRPIGFCWPVSRSQALPAGRQRTGCQRSSPTDSI